MSQIGAFVRTPDGFSGHLKTLTLDVELRLVARTIAALRQEPERTR